MQWIQRLALRANLWITPFGRFSCTYISGDGMNPRNYRVASYLPHRLVDYVHRHCYCYECNMPLGIVRSVRVQVQSYIRGTVHFFVSYVSDGESRARIYRDREIDQLEIIDDRVGLTEITNNLTLMEEEIRQAERWYSDGDFYLDFLKQQYFAFARDIKAILRAHGYR